jgi:hypothetical protein
MPKRGRNRAPGGQRQRGKPVRVRTTVNRDSRPMRR